MSLSGLFKSKVIVHGTLLTSTLKDNTPEQILKLTKKCMQAVQMDRRKWIVPSGISIPYFYYEQCKYLADKLKVTVESAQSFLLLLNKGSSSKKDFANCLKIFKLLYDLATIVENFIRNCCQDEWIQAAMLLNNVSKQVSSLGFDLEVVKQSFDRCLCLWKIDTIHGVEIEIVKEKASIDREVLLRDLNTFLQIRKSTSTNHQLATLLLERLQQSMDQIPFEIGLQGSFHIEEESLKEMEKMGKGAFATVYKALWLGIEVAKKTFYMKGSSDFENEVSILQRLSHPNITSLLGYTKGNRECSIIMELMDEDLFTLIQRRMKEYNVHGYPFDIFEAIDLMLQIGRGMEYLRKMRIIHRDLKSMNILVKHVKARNSKMHCVFAKVADFGLSKSKEESLSYNNQTPNMGSPRWMAPELIKLSIDGWYSEASNVDATVAKHPFNSDVYSFAMVCYEILIGELPFFEERNIFEVKKMVLKGDRPRLPFQCHPKLRNLIERCWSSDASKRPSFSKICLELQHIKCSLPRLILMSAFTTQVTLTPIPQVRYALPQVKYDLPQVRYSLTEVKAITNGFVRKLRIERHGNIYYGKLANGYEVAVKVVVKTIRNFLNEFMQVEDFQKIHCKSLVPLVGYCDEGDELILLYKYMPLGTLQAHLYGDEKMKKPFLDWKTRLQIALSSAEGLKYLHMCNPIIIHSNFNSNNILLGKNFIAKVADYGIPKFPNLLYEIVLARGDTPAILGLNGYLDRESYLFNNFTEKSDVYAFGIVLLELICAQPPHQIKLPWGQLVDEVRTSLLKSVHKEKIKEIVDPSLSGEYNLDAMWKVANLAIQCIESPREHRPNMTTIVQKLEVAVKME